MIGPCLLLKTCWFEVVGSFSLKTYHGQCILRAHKNKTMFRGPSGARRPEASRRTEKLRNAIPLDVRSEISPLCAIVEIRLGVIS